MQGDSATIASEERSIRLLQQQWMQAWVEQDLETLERILAPEYALVVSSMPERLVTREQWISMLSRYLHVPAPQGANPISPKPTNEISKFKNHVLPCTRAGGSVFGAAHIVWS